MDQMNILFQADDGEVMEIVSTSGSRHSRCVVKVWTKTFLIKLGQEPRRSTPVNMELGLAYFEHIMMESNLCGRHYNQQVGRLLTDYVKNARWQQSNIDGLYTYPPIK